MGQLNTLPHSQKDRSRRNGGFTIVEVMITTFLLGVGMLGLMLMQIYALQHGKRAKHRTGGSMIVRDQIERIQNMPFSDSDLDVMDPVTWTRVPWLTSTGTNGEVPVTVQDSSGSQNEIIYTAWYRVKADPIDPSEDLVRQVDLELIWQEQGVANNEPTRTGQPTVAIATVLVNNDR
jgi:Tfp pilus assembly protein PilV